jgi:CDP-diacylglycerol--glycerol-3-phosphate 3-phosphatidyltransferase
MRQCRSAKVVTLPNALSASRIVAAPLLAFAVLTGQPPGLAAGLVVAAALTDLFDGVAARALGKVSDLGASLDPVADKTFILTALWLLWGEGVIRGANAWAALIILWREIVISGLRDHARAHGTAAPVSRLAKAKTAAQFSAVILLFASRVPFRGADACFQAGAGLIWAAAGLALYTGAEYFWRAWRQSWK